jgi:hypothetical protein
VNAVAEPTVIESGPVIAPPVITESYWVSRLFRSEAVIVSPVAQVVFE